MSGDSNARLIHDLKVVGVDVKDPWVLVNSDNQYPDAIPVLMDWLEHLKERVPESDQPPFQELLVRALTVPTARPVAGPLLVRLFREVSDPSGLGPRWVIGNALSVVADDSIVGEMETLARDRNYGKARQMIVLGLARSKDPRVIPTLMDLLNDEDVVAHAVTALGRLRAAPARGAIEAMLSHPSPLVRKEAKRALKKIFP